MTSDFLTFSAISSCSSTCNWGTTCGSNTAITNPNVRVDPSNPLKLLYEQNVPAGYSTSMCLYCTTLKNGAIPNCNGAYVTIGTNWVCGDNGALENY